MSAPLRVLFVSHSSAPSGAELALLRLLPHLPAAGIDAHVCLAREGPVADSARAVGAPVHILDLDARLLDHRRERIRPVRDALRFAPALSIAALRLAALCSRLRPDAVHPSSMKALPYASAAARLSRRPLTWEVHDIPRPPYLSAGAALAFQAALNLARPRAVLVHSQAVAAALPARARATVIPYAADLRGGPVPLRPDGPLRLGMAARLAPWKGQLIAVRAMAEIALAHPGAELLLAGSALFGEEEYADRVAREVTRLRLGGNVRMLGHVPDPIAFYGGVDIGIHASIQPEPFGISILDAFAAGRPVVAARGGGVEEVIGAGEAGVTVEPGDPSALAGAVLRLAAGGREELARRGSAGRARAEQFAPGAIATRTAAFFRAHLAMSVA